MRRTVIAFALCAAACRSHRPDAAEQARAAAASDSLTLAFGDTAAGGAPGARAAAVTSVGEIDPCTDRVRGDDFTLRKTTLVDVYVPPGFEPIGAEKSERDAEKTGYARFTWRSADNSVITIYPAAISRKHGQMAMGIRKECDLTTAGAQLHIDIGVIGQNTVVRGVFMFPASMALVFEGHGTSPARLAEALHSMRTVFVSPRWGARP